MALPSPPSRSFFPSTSSTASTLSTTSFPTPPTGAHNPSPPSSPPPTSPLPQLPHRLSLPKLPDHPLRMHPATHDPGSPPLALDPVKHAGNTPQHCGRPSSPTLPDLAPSAVFQHGGFDEMAPSIVFDARFNYTEDERARRVRLIEEAKCRWDGFMRESLRVTEERAGDVYGEHGAWIGPRTCGGEAVSGATVEGTGGGGGAVAVCVERRELEVLQAEVRAVRQGVEEGRREEDVQSELRRIERVLGKLLA